MVFKPAMRDQPVRPPRTRLEERKPAYLVPLDEIREKLRAHISEEKVAKAEADEKARLRADAEIEILIPLERPKQQN